MLLDFAAAIWRAALTMSGYRLSVVRIELRSFRHNLRAHQSHDINASNERAEPTIAAWLAIRARDPSSRSPPDVIRRQNGPQKAGYKINSFCGVALLTAVSGMPLSKVTSLPSC
jgi:hypothetical protein